MRVFSLLTGEVENGWELDCKSFMFFSVDSDAIAISKALSKVSFGSAKGRRRILESSTPQTS